MPYFHRPSHIYSNKILSSLCLENILSIIGSSHTVHRVSVEFKVFHAGLINYLKVLTIEFIAKNNMFLSY